jgi:hypothetical protein
MARAIRECCDRAAPFGVSIGLQNHHDLAVHSRALLELLADIGRGLGFAVPHIGLRGLDRDRRMLPAGLTADLGPQIQQRMHEESVVGF